MRKHRGTPSRRDKHFTLAAISPPGVAQGRSFGGQQSGLAGCKPPPLFMRRASSCSSQGRRQGEPEGNERGTRGNARGKISTPYMLQPLLTSHALKTGHALTELFN